MSTLDEYCHPSLDEGTLEDRNRDQVLSRYQKEMPDNQKIILTVPQIWIWTIGKDVITAMQKPIFDELDRKVFDTIENHDEVATMLVSQECSAPSSTLFNDLFVGIMISNCVHKLNSRSRLGLLDSIFGIFERSISELSAGVREYTKSEALSKNYIDSEKKSSCKLATYEKKFPWYKACFSNRNKSGGDLPKSNFPNAGLLLQKTSSSSHQKLPEWCLKFWRSWKGHRRSSQSINDRSPNSMQMPNASRA